MSGLSTCRRVTAICDDQPHSDTSGRQGIDDVPAVTAQLR
jgi:hypothetical protein